MSSMQYGRVLSRRGRVTNIQQEKNLDWFPRMQAMSLSDAEADSEQNELRTLQLQLHKTNQLVATLSTQLSDLREQVRPAANYTC